MNKNMKNLNEYQKLCQETALEFEEKEKKRLSEEAPAWTGMKSKFYLATTTP